MQHLASHSLPRVQHHSSTLFQPGTRLGYGLPRRSLKARTAFLETSLQTFVDTQGPHQHAASSSQHQERGDSPFQLEHSASAASTSHSHSGAGPTYPHPSSQVSQQQELNPSSSVSEELDIILLTSSPQPCVTVRLHQDPSSSEHLVAHPSLQGTLQARAPDSQGSPTPWQSFLPDSYDSTSASPTLQHNTSSVAPLTAASAAVALVASTAVALEAHARVQGATEVLTSTPTLSPNSNTSSTTPSPPSPLTTTTATSAPSSAQQQADSHACSPYRLWALLLLASCYVHSSATSFSIPVMLPMVSSSLALDDLQGAMLTTGYSYLYALALVPMGLLVDRTNARPALLGTSLAVWSSLTMAASYASNFGELMIARVGLACAHSAQNVISFGMIPELFPTTKSTAMAFYNCAIYLGRGLMYLVCNMARELINSDPAAIDAASQQLINRDAYGNILVPLEKLDLHLTQLVYTTGDLAAIRPSSPIYEFAAVAGGLQDTAWRQVLQQLALPGAFLAAALFFTVKETRDANHNKGSAASPSLPVDTQQPNARQASGLGQSEPSTQLTDQASTSGSSSVGASSSSDSAGKTLMGLMKNMPFMTITAAAALNDVGSYALIGWQSTFYERVYHLEVTQYAPVLATVLPLAGIIGGVGGGLLADRLTQSGKRAWVTVATSLVAAPLIWASLTAETPELSFLWLGLGFGLSEGWRAPAAVMIRSVVPQNISSTAVSMYLCLRNLLGGLGPLLIAHMASVWDLQSALQLLPPFYLASAGLFWSAEQQIAALNATMRSAAGSVEGAAAGEVSVVPVPVTESAPVPGRLQSRF